VDIEDHWVQNGTGRGHVVPVAFTVPDLGGDARTVTVEIVISGPGKPRTLERDLDYLGRARPVTNPPAAVVPGPVVPGPAPDVAPHADPAPSPVPSSVGGAATTAPAAAPSAGLPLQRGERRLSQAPRQAASRAKHRRASRRAHHPHARHAPATTHRSKHVPAGAHRARHSGRPIVCPCRFGHLEGTHSAQPGGHVAQGSTAKLTSAPAIKSVRVGSGGLTAAAFVPALVALAALALGATAIARRRRIASRPGRI
jgi:hypothetical protein